MKIDSVLETCLYVDDLGEARDFYERILGLELHSEAPDRHVFFKLNNGMFLLFNADATQDPASELPRHGANGAGHAAFRVLPEDIPRWREHLKRHDVPIEQEVTWPNGIPSIYFRDPSGNVLEVSTAALWGFGGPA